MKFPDFGYKKTPPLYRDGSPWFHSVHSSCV